MNKIYYLTLTLALSSLALTTHAQTPKLDKVFAPVVVGVPPSDAYIGLSKMPDGEIRHYNYGEQKVGNEPYYLSSRDYGFTWKRVNVSPDMVYADTQSPISGEFVRIFSTTDGVYAVRTKGGINGGRDINKIDDEFSLMIKPPVFIRDGKRIVVSAHRLGRKGSFTYTSDDDGLTWNISNHVTVPLHEINGFHKGLRWNHGAVEPTVTELSDGRLWMIMRTSQDNHYQTFSTDGGVTWGESTPSPFYGTITMPTFHKLRDGRLLFFWSNTTPLPELQGNTGVWDDVFTNRNATHVAISEDDGKTWIGARELFLDEGRNQTDFASKPGIDKSVHQAQCVEVGDDKVLVSIGQNTNHRKMLMFDIDWLYEDERADSFENGLNDWTTFKYYKGFQGHCGYNRVEGNLLVDHCDKPNTQMLNIRYAPNDTLVGDNDGALWNFPATQDGTFTTSIKLPKDAKPVTLLLNDRWFNASDTVATYNAMYKLSLDRKQLKIKDENWHTIEIKWTHNKKAIVYVDGRKRLTLPLEHPTTLGISYAHFISGNQPDPIGIFVESVAAKRE
jgi:hypothetical protein